MNDAPRQQLTGGCVVAIVLLVLTGISGLILEYASKEMSIPWGIAGFIGLILFGLGTVIAFGIGMSSMDREGEDR